MLVDQGAGRAQMEGGTEQGCGGQMVVAGPWREVAGSRLKYASCRPAPASAAAPLTAPGEAAWSTLHLVTLKDLTCGS